MRISRRAGLFSSVLFSSGVLLAEGCAHPPTTKPAPTVAELARAPQPTAPVARAPLPALPALVGEEEADRARAELDLLAMTEPRWYQLRDQLLRYYVATATPLCEQGQAEDAFALFSTALRLFDASELQGAPPPEAQLLLPLSQRLDRLFSKRGAHPQVVVTLMVQLTLRPADAALRQRLDLIRAWLAGSDDGMRNLMRMRSGSLPDLLSSPPPTLESDLDQAYRVWPARVIRDELVPMYRSEAVLLSSGGKKSPKDFLQSLSATLRRKGLTNSPAFKIGRAYLRASLAQEAVSAIKQLGLVARLSGEEARLLSTIEETLAAPAGPSDEGDRLLPAVKLATSLAQNPEDAEVSLQICRDVAQRAPKLLPAQLCLGELAIGLERKGLALQAFERARALAPGERPIWEMLGRLYLERLGDLLIEERTAELESVLRKIEAFYESMRQQFPEQPPTTGIALALAEVGRGYYNAGLLADSIRFLERSNSVEPNALALEQLGVLQLRRGEAPQAAATLERARAVFMASVNADPQVKLLYSARLGRLIAEAFDAQPEGASKARELRQQALRQFATLLDNSNLSGERATEAEVERGKLYYQQGDREQALAAFRRAADLGRGEPDSKAPGQAFVDILAFLVPRGELDEAVSMYHRALGVRLPENMKVYCSLWINDLLQRAGQAPDPLAQGFLNGVQGGKWHADLARWSTGKINEQLLLQRADTTGRQAEAHFYLGMERLRIGDKKAAFDHFRRVVESQMLGYFEHEMAREDLRLQGAPTVPQISPKPPATKPRTSPPPGSI
ncbi:MAG: tetratricopeptide repeat protein [Elusimicrobia bacterium]|nr:MAG: tetratricopeptide repeat protein [Elusimicrobiota bacterium]